MQFLALIYENEAERATWSEEMNAANMKAYFDYTNAVKESGEFVAGDALMPTNTATSVRIRNGELVTTDGPFAETKEQLGGYYLLECENLDQAIESASRIPAAKNGTVEVRPIMVFD